MTDKQIIIDGVDVSGCLFHSLTTMGYAGYNYCKCFQCVCECHNDCYYKQYKRKEQECEELNKWLPIVTRLEEQFKSHEKAKGIDYKTYAEQVFTELDQLKAENEKLNTENKHLNDLLNQALKELEVLQ